MWNTWECQMLEPFLAQVMQKTRQRSREQKSWWHEKWQRKKRNEHENKIMNAKNDKVMLTAAAANSVQIKMQTHSLIFTKSMHVNITRNIVTRKSIATWNCIKYSPVRFVLLFLCPGLANCTVHCGRFELYLFKRHYHVFSIINNQSKNKLRSCNQF